MIESDDIRALPKAYARRKPVADITDVFAETPGQANGRSRRPANNTRKELVRERLLEKAAELFCANGFSKTSINDIADSLSLKRSSVYHYFQNKEEIVRALFIDEYGRRCNELLELFERKELTALERLAGVAKKKEAASPCAVLCPHRWM